MASAGRTWRAQTTAPAPPEEVLEVLTHPAAVARWSPVGFDIEELTGTRLRAGTRARVVGALAGQHVEFDVDVVQADLHGLLLQARGPVDLDVEYAIAPAPRGSAIAAAITLHERGGLSKALAARAVHLLLAVGALDAALARVVRELGQHEPDARAAPSTRRPAPSARRRCSRHARRTADAPGARVTAAS